MKQIPLTAHHFPAPLKWILFTLHSAMQGAVGGVPFNLTSWIPPLICFLDLSLTCMYTCMELAEPLLLFCSMMELKDRFYDFCLGKINFKERRNY